MNCSNVRISLDIHKNCSGAVVCAKRGDVGRRIHISLTDGCIPYRIGADCRAVFTAEKPDKNVIYNDCIIQGDTIIYDMTEQTTAVVGRTDCEIKLYGADGKLITSPSFSLIISDTVCDDGDEVESSSEFSALTAAMAEVEELKKNGLRGEPGEQGPQGPAGPPGPKGESSGFFISIFPAGDGYASDETMADIQAAEEAGRTIYCMMETDAQQWIYLPKVKEQDGARYFSAVFDGVEWLVTIALDDEGGTVLNVSHREIGGLPEDVLKGSTKEITPVQAMAAIQSGRRIVLTHTDSIYGDVTVSWLTHVAAYNSVMSAASVMIGNNSFLIQLWGDLSSGTWTSGAFQQPTMDSIPTKLPSPHPLTINGYSYDGSAAVAIHTPGGAPVQAYGAKGDGTADDTTAFRVALSLFRTVYVPGGTYKLSGTLVIRENCCLELSQDTVLQFTQTKGNCIEMRGSATLRGNHAVITAAYGLTGNVISMDTSQDGADHASIPPYAKSDPMFKRQRFVYDVNIIKPNDAGFNRSEDGVCNGTAIYMHCDGLASISWMWGVSVSGVRIAGGFSYGIHAINADDPDGYTDNAWNHDMRIEAVIEACEVGVALENCNGAHLSVTVQPCQAVDGTAYAKWGVYLNDCRFVDMLRSRVWDWNADNTLWTEGGEHQHIALVGNCRGLLLDDFLCHEVSTDIRSLIYTDTDSNYDTMTILQEPGNKWFKSVDGTPYFNDGTANRRLRLSSEKITAEQAEFIHPADGYYTYTPNFTNLASNCRDGYCLDTAGADMSLAGYAVTDYIPIDGGNSHVYRLGGEGISWSDSYGYCRIAWYDADKKLKGSVMSWDKIGSNIYYPVKVEDDSVAAAFSTNANVAPPNGAAYFRVSVMGTAANIAITIDEEQSYTAIWHGEPKRLDESIKVTKDNISGNIGDEWETIIDYTVPEDCAEVFLKTDLNGNPFKLKRAIVEILLLPIAEPTEESWVAYTVDGTVTGGIYNNDYYRYGMGYIPKEAGKYRLIKFEVEKTPNGAHLLSLRETHTPEDYNENGLVYTVLPGAKAGFREAVNAKTLAPIVTEISAVGIGYYMTAIGAGTHIVMLGVRE